MIMSVIIVLIYMKVLKSVSINNNSVSTLDDQMQLTQQIKHFISELDLNHSKNQNDLQIIIELLKRQEDIQRENNILRQQELQIAQNYLNYFNTTIKSTNQEVPSSPISDTDTSRIDNGFFESFIGTDGMKENFQNLRNDVQRPDSSVKVPISKRFFNNGLFNYVDLPGVSPWKVNRSK